MSDEKNETIRDFLNNLGEDIKGYADGLESGDPDEINGVIEDLKEAICEMKDLEKQCKQLLKKLKPTKLKTVEEKSQP